MRSKKVVPVGQGCKRTRARDTLFETEPMFRCTCHPDLFLKICYSCGEWYHSPYPQTKTCSDKCRKRLSRSRTDTFFQSVLQFAGGVK